jgi:predicted Zn-dependent peptidase
LLDFDRVPQPEEWRASIHHVTDADIQAIARQVFLDRAPAIAEIRP